MNAALSCGLTAVRGIDHSAWSYTYWESPVDLKKKKKIACSGCSGSGLGHHTYTALFYASVMLFVCPGLAAAPMPGLGVSWRKSRECKRKQLFCPHCWTSEVGSRNPKPAGSCLPHPPRGTQWLFTRNQSSFFLDGCHSNEAIPDHIHKIHV